jgi:hypothetical protein
MKSAPSDAHLRVAKYRSAHDRPVWPLLPRGTQRRTI